MDGYLDNKTRVLNEWYNLFKQKHCTVSNKALENWKYITKFGLSDFENNYYKYYSFRDFFKYNFIFNNSLTFDIRKLRKVSLSIDCHKLVFVNGQFLPKFSDTIINPWILNLDRDINRDYTPLQKTSIYPSFFLYLTELLSDSVIQIKLPAQSKVKKPLYLLHIHAGTNVSNQLVTSHYYYHLNVEKDTDSCVIEHFININQYGHFTGTRTLMTIDEKAALNHIKLIFENQNSYHVSHQSINVKQSSNINSNTFIISGPKFINQQVNAITHHSKSSISINSLSLLSKNDICDIQTYLEHNNKGQSISKQLHKTIVKDHSTSIFNGLIKVNPESIDTDAKMINNNLLLNQSASVYSIPKLEIYSDAVQCGHGSTISQINNNHLFYLNTRGIKKDDALKMLIFAFTEEMTKKIKHSFLKSFVIKRINHALIRKE